MYKTASAAVGIALLASAGMVFADTATSTSGMKEKMMDHKTVNIQCVQTAVDAREQGVMDAFSTFTTSMSAALTARKTALHNAWGMTDSKARTSARSAAWKSYESAAKAAHSALKSARTKAWSTAKSAVKACGSTAEESHGYDGNGSLGL